MGEYHVTDATMSNAVPVYAISYAVTDVVPEVIMKIQHVIAIVYKHLTCIEVGFYDIKPVTNHENRSKNAGMSLSNDKISDNM